MSQKVLTSNQFERPQLFWRSKQYYFSI